MNDILKNLSGTIKGRKNFDDQKSYTASLLHAGIEKCSKKFSEEAIELVIAAVNEDLDRFNNEAADVVYHLLVLIESKGSHLNDVLSVLAERQGMSGHVEKESRKT